jgi:hypothetical protein
MGFEKRERIVSVVFVLIIVFGSGFFGFLVGSFGMIGASYNPDVYISSEDGKYTLLLQEGSFLHSQKIEIRLKNGDEWTDYKGCLSFEYTGDSLLNEGMYEVKWEEEKITLILFQKSDLNNDELIERESHVIQLQGGENE